MAGDGSAGSDTLSGALDRGLRSPLYLVGGLLSGTVVTTGSEVLSTILLAWIRRNTGLLPSSPSPTPTPTTVTPTGNSSVMTLSHYTSGPWILAWLILLVAAVFLIALGFRRWWLGGYGAAEEPRSTAPGDGAIPPSDEVDTTVPAPPEDTDSTAETPSSPSTDRGDQASGELPDMSPPAETGGPQRRLSRALGWLTGLRGLLWGSIGGAVVGLALGALYLPAVAGQVAIAVGVAGAVIGDVILT